MNILPVAALLLPLHAGALALAEEPLPTVGVRYWVSPDRTEVLVALPEQAVAYYFNNNANRLCYTYEINGRWEAGEESAMLQSEDGRAVAGVLLYSARELDGYEGHDLVTRAANHLKNIYETSIGKRLARVELEPFPSARSGTVKWTASWSVKSGGRRLQMVAGKVLLEIAPGWLAQVTVNGTPDDDGTARQLLGTLSTTAEPECYWPLIHQSFPEIP